MLLIDGVRVEFGRFPNGESNLNFNKLTFSSKSVVTFKYVDDSSLMELFVLKSYMDEYGVTPALQILYMPYSRMDRRNDFYTFNLKYISNFINSMKFKSVEVIDAHSDVTLALLDRCSSTSLLPSLFRTFFKEVQPTNPLIFYPDAGAQKRYGKDFQGYSSAFGIKERDFSDGKITNYKVIGEVKEGQDVVIVDDLCSKGGTFMGAATALKELGAGDIYLLVTHCEHTIFDGDIFKTDFIKKVYTTNSILEVVLSELPTEITADRLSITKLY